jgi:hypothetical protein
VTDLATLAASLEQCYDVLEAPCAGLSSDQWQAQSLCPDWDTRGVVTHLGRMERVMTGRLSASAEETPPLDRIAPQEVAALDDQAFAAGSLIIFTARRADMTGLQAQDLDRPS